MEIYLTRAEPHHMHQMRALARRHTDAIGFLPDQAVRHYIGLGSAIVATAHGELVGYLLGHFSMISAPALARVYQIVVHRDHQSKKCGTALLAAFERESIRLHAKALLAHVAEDLPAVRFWMSQGYDCYSTAPGGRRRDRRSIAFTKEFIANAFEDVDARPPRHQPGGRHQHQVPLPIGNEGADWDGPSGTQIA